ncbi:MAG: DNA photolyase [Desulfobacteraceae bacterium]|nr:DNA photolyase [Desulfobacteraceae bacterium]
MTIKKLFADPYAINTDTAERFAETLGMRCTPVEEASEIYRQTQQTPDPIHKGKEYIFLTQNRGAFIRECPGTRDYTCCGYKILHVGTYCYMDCSYCILQAYFHPPLLQYFTNHNDLKQELQREFAKNRISRIGTGEFTDSLIWEVYADLSSGLIQEFSTQHRAVLELKTKTTAIGHLGNVSHNRKTIISWSLNTPKVIAEQEKGTSSLTARFTAAATCERWGYPLAFHFDPMFVYPGCKEDYGKVVQQLFTHVNPGNIVWISMGTFRYIPALKQIIEKRFPDSDIIYGEFIPGLDGKMRYFKPLRVELYRFMVDLIKEIAPDVQVYLCMESDEVWMKAFGYTPEKYGGLDKILDRKAMDHCGLYR